MAAAVEDANYYDLSALDSEENGHSTLEAFRPVPRAKIIASGTNEWNQ